MSADIVTCLQAILAINTTSLIETAEEAQVNASRPLKRTYPEPADDTSSSEVEDPVFQDVDVGRVIEDDGDEEMEEVGGDGDGLSEADNVSIRTARTTARVLTTGMILIKLAFRLLFLQRSRPKKLKPSRVSPLYQ